MLNRLSLIFLTLILMLASPAFAEDNRISIRGSNLDIPRFVTLKTDKANMRAGPGLDYPIKFEYRRTGLPLKVVGEFDIWREVIDHEGTRGWMHRQTLSGRRMALITGNMEKIRRNDDHEARVLAVAEEGVLAEISRCRGQWCRIAVGEVDGWIRKNAIWGILEQETLE